MAQLRTHCQICARAIKANTGLIAHHGYKRPGHGWQTASCFGARYRPYEVASDALPLAIADLTRYITRTAANLAEFVTNPPATLTYRRTDAWGKVLEEKILPLPVPFDQEKPNYIQRADYGRIFRARRAELQRDLAGAKETLVHLEQRLRDWKPAAVEAA